MNNHTPVRRCSRCVLPESYPGIRFNEQGECHLCAAFQKPPVRGEEALRRLLTSGQGDPYDCVVTISGGRDSSYVLYYAVKVLGLKTLALNYDNGFRHPQALVNMKAACERTGVSLLQFKSRDNLNARVAAAALRAAIPQGPGACCQFVCRQCYTGGLSFLYSTAEEYKIPYIIWGDSLIERVSFIPVRNRLFFKSPLRYSLSKRSWAFLRFLYLLRQLRNERLPSGNRRLDVRYPKLRAPGIEEIHLFDYIEWDRREIKKVITRELGWQKPPESLSSWRFDCYLHRLLNYCHKKAIGFNHDIDGLAKMVRAGKMTRAEAMDLIDQGFDSGEWDRELERLVTKALRLSASDIRRMKSWQ